MTFKIMGGVIAIALWAYIAFFSESASKSSILTEIQQTSKVRPTKSEKPAIGLKKEVPARLPSAIEDSAASQPAGEEAKLREFFKSRTNQNWTFEKNEGRIEKIFGGEVKKLVNTDEKLKQFITDLTTEMGFENLVFSEHKPAQKKSDHEIINEFRQTIGETEVYGAYFRAFRDNDSLSASFFINEFKKYEEYSSLENFTQNELESKIELFYERLGKNLKSRNCSSKVYYVGEKKTAELAYRCTVRTAAALPETFEVIVSTATADVLFQKRITIFN